MATASTITAPPSMATSSTLPSSTSLHMEIRIKTLNDHTFSLTVPRAISIRDLKTTLQGTTSVPPQRQRLIYRGKLLRDGDLLSAYNVEDGHMVHMVARPERAQQQQQQQPTSPPSSSLLLAPLHDTAELLQSRLARLDASTASSLATMRQRLGAAVDSGFSSMPPPSSQVHHDRLQFLRSRYGNPHDASPLASEPESEASTAPVLPSVEHIRQGLMTVQSMLSLPATSSRDDGLSPASAAPIRRRQFFIGQWLDVKDTVNQWLEGTVLDLNVHQVYVHYHGWPTRWDEWIDATSPRLAAFRTRTLHANTSRHLSPAPSLSNPQQVMPASADTPTTIRALLPQMRSVLHEMLPFVDALAAAVESEAASVDTGDSDDDMGSQAPQIRELVATVAPLFDRVGRLLADAAPAVQSLATAREPRDSAWNLTRGGSATSDIPTFRELIVRQNRYI
ncbi:hypothetical protein, variant [Aphanomyces astaci]|uniref:Ubiquitin-like domain-containing protein n=1 Tax=Aphanomyces astaci TaxID=112090 RepID=W4FQX5_APHAT|nr:hypothetical protein, variant [Aphanomyces astaci]ETV69356.1 hypothetical protein, variant [Aphanomyces astaci]|eukprot:XP_009841213.1 hypothetical protein, variant [Aphanomyces astaci]